jgi:hypothetical protein
MMGILFLALVPQSDPLVLLAEAALLRLAESVRM